MITQSCTIYIFFSVFFFCSCKCIGKTIIKQGDTVDHFYIIANGKVQYEVDGKSEGEAGPGSTFGELALLYSSTRNATVIAATDPTQLFRVDATTFRYTMRRTVKETSKRKLHLLKNIRILEHFEDADLQRLVSF